MPVWHDSTRKFVEDGRLAILGVTQEQHPDRCRLFAQWKGFGWPILHDPINVLRSEAVPIVVAIDEHGIVRSVGPRPETFARDFLDKTFADDAEGEPEPLTGPPDPAAPLRKAKGTEDRAAWREAGDALVLWGGAGRIDEAIDAYAHAIRLDPADKYAMFRLGVALRMRHESSSRQPGDFQAAVDAWGRALALDPNQYIWRRRIEQYGPLLTKPYPFYDWVDTARREIAARGEAPIPLAEEPTGSELAAPARAVVAEADAPAEPDPEGRIRRDADGLIDAEVAVIPKAIKPGQAARVHFAFRPDKAKTGHWNNESTPLRVWVAGVDGWTVANRLLEAKPGAGAESDEVRRLDVEVKAPADASGKVRLAAYALYNVCEQEGGTCLYLRRDLTVEVEVLDANGAK